jgi:hypothetical protein
MRRGNWFTLALGCSLSIEQAALVLAPSAAIAAPVTLQCTIKGKSVSDFGRLAAVTVDLETLTVEIETLEKMRGWRWRYRDGQTAALLVKIPPDAPWQPDMPATMPVNQFVQVTSQSIMVGWRTSDGEPGRVSSFNRSALDRHPAPCIWHSAAEFELTWQPCRRS